MTFCFLKDGRLPRDTRRRRETRDTRTAVQGKRTRARREIKTVFKGNEETRFFFEIVFGETFARETFANVPTKGAQGGASALGVHCRCVTFRAHGDFRGVTKKRTYIASFIVIHTLVQRDLYNATSAARAIRTINRLDSYHQHPALCWFATAPFGIVSCAFCATRNIWYACVDPRRDPSCCTS